MIRLAEELSFSPPPRCPHPGCNVGLLPYGRSEPFAVDDRGRPYCRDHGAAVDADYPRTHAEYAERRRAEREEGFRQLEEATAPRGA